MDIEKLRKINALSKELRKHGIAESSDVAVRKAGEMVETETGALLQEMGSSVPLPESQFRNASRSVRENSAESSVIVSGASKDELVQVYSALSSALKEQELLFRRELASLSSALNVLSERVALMNETLSERKVGSQQSVQSSQSAQTESLRSPPVQQGSSNPPHPPSHPRQGDYKPGDVSIEKMFYFGKK